MSKNHMPHSIARNALAIADQMDPLKKTKNPAIAAVCAFAFGGVGLGLYLESWMDFLVPWGILIVIGVLGLPFGELPALFVPIFWGFYAYRRVVASNAKIAGQSNDAIIEVEILAEPSPVRSIHPTQGQLQMKMRRLDNLLAEGILSPTEHAAKRKRLLN